MPAVTTAVSAASRGWNLRNPLRAFEQVYRKLKPGGQYVLVVPDKHLTFDRDRAVTTLEHLVEDFEEPSAERDVPHYFEFFSKVPVSYTHLRPVPE